MNVILLERIEKLGQMGDEVTVKDGYARNFLLPRQKALRATKENRERFETQRAQLEAENLQRRTEADSVAARMDDVSVIMVRQAGDSGQLYGSVTARDIATGVTEAGYTVNRSQVVLNRPIKTLGLHPVELVLHPEVRVGVTVNVARSEEEAKLQAAGIDVTAATDEEDEILEDAESVFENPPEEAVEDAGDAESDDGGTASEAPDDQT